ncbi:MAG: ABC transporter permease subunit [Planctomycetota bacterium]
MLKKLKLFLLKVIDLTALGFLEPYVRLAYGEEPKVQLKKIVQFTLIPMLALALFVGIWGFLAPRHTTKSGAVPTPNDTWVAWEAIMTFHNQESQKAEAFLLEGEAQAELLSTIEARQAELDPLVEQATAELEAIREVVSAEKAAEAEPLDAKLEESKEKRKELVRTKRAEFKERAAALAAGDAAGREQLKADYLAHDAEIEAMKEAESELNSQIGIIEARKDSREREALLVQTKFMNERAHVAKMIDYLTEDGQPAKLASLNDKLAELEASYAGAAGSETYKILSDIVRTQSRIAKTREAEYAKPWTLPMQIIRSILCVFVGFTIGVMVAVPIGVLCGLSSTFMAAMTPFIALFKPVSPIVWLLLLMIIVGGFFPDPNNSVVLEGLTDTTNTVIGLVPYFGAIVTNFDINIAFIASALTVSMCSLWATLVNTALGVASVDKDHLNVARVLKLGVFSRLFKIILPSALPLVFAGMRISLGVGWMVLIAAELLAGSEGVGKFTWDQFNNGASDSFAKIVCMVFVVGAIGLVLDRIMIIFQRLVSFEGSVAAV